MSSEKTIHCWSLVSTTYNWSLQPFSQDYDLVSHTTYVVCVNFIHEWWDLQFKVDSERQIFEKLFMAILFTLRVFARNLLRGSRRRNTFCILFWCLAWGSNPGFSSNKPTHHLLDHGDFPTLLYGNTFSNWKGKHGIQQTVDDTTYLVAEFQNCSVQQWTAGEPKN